MDAKPFHIHVAAPVLEDLQMRLRCTRWTNVTDDAAWVTGTNKAYLRDLVTHWLVGYDWRAEEEKLNALPQFEGQIDGDRVHFVHARASGARPVPLLLLHGWPDSFLRFREVLPFFGDPTEHGGHASDTYDVVVPSLPGFAFTGSLRRARHDQPARASARLIWRLMTELLGYERFAVAGGDGGSVIAQCLAIDHPDAVVGIHLTDLGWPALNVDPKSVPKAERQYLEALGKARMADGAYALVQMSTPRSLAAALNDSPVGLASWIVDRFHSWVDGDLDAHVGKDHLLTNIMLYWVTQTIGASIFNYHAEARSPSLTPSNRVNVPVGLALFPRDLGGVPPRSFAERTLNVRRFTQMPRGGHFGALEEPELFARDVVEFFRPLTALTHPVQTETARMPRHVARTI
ncbi:MAG TPA: epoxide hydrolase [Polyangia bacterium]|jgi:pimeloyl-ACP methyl ester carboxylesterase|nr:epoxide hydrolase [Polyangia bacterium]